ncbi:MULTISPECIES: hypothetical protein [Thermomonospora]|uniref:Uncharacterized protein n=1 Tax=Thermomonospora curvata (strain ATCC 19995 / DSM 43183 / JCM 3096 / KCTC 9072 / NBRC 15933 / NCIMB 10081 / Henssen B9) TaxID=471852 RepID=D1A7R7_THECD|nr:MULTISPECIES: hypothetical protein [Thermomonospora]ACY98439.1 hypothetical protein Tcur_2894 [Thermomonospora curvata DSM 43183]
MEIGGLHFTYLNVALFGLAVFLLMGVISFIRQGIKGGAVLLAVLTVMAFVAGVLWL